MSMNIKNPEAHALAREFAALEGTTVTDAVVISLREALARRRAEQRDAERSTRVHATLDRMREQLRTNPGPSLWEINKGLYDDLGLPR